MYFAGISDFLHMGPHAHSKARDCWGEPRKPYCPRFNTGASLGEEVAHMQNMCLYMPSQHTDYIT